MERQGEARSPSFWCLVCVAAAEPRCLQEHELINCNRVMTEQLGVLAPAAGELLLLEGGWTGEQTMQALTLLAREDWDITLRSGDHEVRVAVRNRDDDPLIKAMWLVLAKKSVAIEERAGHVLAPPPATSSTTRTSRNPRHASDTASSSTASSSTATSSMATSSTATNSSGRFPGAASGPPAARSRTARPTGLVVIVKPERADRANQIERDNVMRSARGVRRMDVRWCRKNVDWTVALLTAVEPTVEELSLLFPSDDHVRAVQAMALLQRLSIRCDAYTRIILVPETPRGHAGLRWLSVWRLPRPTLRMLLTAHARTLETLWLFVGTPGPATARWPFACTDVHVLLDECRLLGLRRLVLARNTEASIRHGDLIHHSAPVCAQQLAAVRGVLMQAEAEVLCDVCDRVRLEEF